MTELTKIIEQDDLETFKLHFDLKDWKKSITTIENYAGTNEYIKEVSYDNCDCFKYALHCESDKIFNYLLPLVDTDKHGENYGWPLLAMALKKNRYDYANSIILHPSFSAYEMYHTNCFRFIENKDKIEEHIDFLFNYIERHFERWDFKSKHLIYCFTDLVCYSPETFDRFNEMYQKKLKNENVNVLEMFKDNMDTLAKEILYSNFNPFILDKLNDTQFKSLIESVMDDKIILVPLFESGDIKGLNYLLKEKELIQHYLNGNSVMFSYLPLNSLLFLMDNGIDIWFEDEENHSPIDYILEYNNIKDEKTNYLINHYTQQIHDRIEKRGRDNDVLKYCQQKLLSEQISDNKPKSPTKKL